jgi:hypothetical protein
MRLLRLVVIFYRMRHLLTLSVIALLAIFSVVGCGGGNSQGSSSQGEQEDPHGGSAKLDLRPEDDSGVSGSATFEDGSDGVLIKLELRGLPRPNTSYLAHIHPGTCAKEAEEGHAHEQGHAHDQGDAGEGEGQEHEEEYVFGHGEGGEVSYALSQVESNSEGRGSSTTMFGQLSVDKLFSGEPKHVMVHEAGSGNPPVLTCADLERAG